MEWLNHHHLLYFWVVAREGSIVRASEVLHLTPQTISAQVRTLEQSMGQALFDRVGRGLVLSETGQIVKRYADEIFSLSRELLDTVRGRPAGRPLQLRVGVADALPKMICQRLLEPALHLDEPMQILCREEGVKALLAELAVHRLDLVLNDAPMPPNLSVRAYNHMLGQCGVTWMAARPLARRVQRRFPASLGGAPVLLPTQDTALRRSLEPWFERHGIRPKIVGEFVDSGLLSAFGQAGEGLFPVADVIADAVCRQYRVVPVGTADGVVDSFYAISVERRVRHPAVAAICDAARASLF